MIRLLGQRHLDELLIALQLFAAQGRVALAGVLNDHCGEMHFATYASHTGCFPAALPPSWEISANTN